MIVVTKPLDYKIKLENSKLFDYNRDTYRSIPFEDFGQLLANTAMISISQLKAIETITTGQQNPPAIQTAYDRSD